MDVIIGCHPDKLGWEKINMPSQHHHRSTISRVRADLANLSFWTKIRNCAISCFEEKTLFASPIYLDNLFMIRTLVAGEISRPSRRHLNKNKGRCAALAVFINYTSLCGCSFLSILSLLSYSHQFNISIETYQPKPPTFIFLYTWNYFSLKNLRLCSFLGIYLVFLRLTDYVWNVNENRAVFVFLELARLQITDFAQEKSGFLFATKMIFIGIICCLFDMAIWQKLIVWA